MVEKRPQHEVHHAEDAPLVPPDVTSQTQDFCTKKEAEIKAQSRELPALQITGLQPHMSSFTTKSV